MSVISDIKIRPLERGDLHFVHKINNNDVIMRYWFEAVSYTHLTLPTKA